MLHVLKHFLLASLILPFRERRHVRRRLRTVDLLRLYHVVPARRFYNSLVGPVVSVLSQRLVLAAVVRRVRARGGRGRVLAIRLRTGFFIFTGEIFLLQLMHCVRIWNRHQLLSPLLGICLFLPNWLSDYCLVAQLWGWSILCQWAFSCDWLLLSGKWHILLPEDPSDVLLFLWRWSHSRKVWQILLILLLRSIVKHRPSSHLRVPEVHRNTVQLSSLERVLGSWHSSLHHLSFHSLSVHRSVSWLLLHMAGLQHVLLGKQEIISDLDFLVLRKVSLLLNLHHLRRSELLLLLWNLHHLLRTVLLLLLLNLHHLLRTIMLLLKMLLRWEWRTIGFVTCMPERVAMAEPWLLSMHLWLLLKTLFSLLHDEGLGHLGLLFQGWPLAPTRLIFRELSHEWWVNELFCDLGSSIARLNVATDWSSLEVAVCFALLMVMRRLVWLLVLPAGIILITSTTHSHYRLLLYLLLLLWILELSRHLFVVHLLTVLPGNVVSKRALLWAVLTFVWVRLAINFDFRPSVIAATMPQWI